jgi:hypothetical protein
MEKEKEVFQVSNGSVDITVGKFVSVDEAGNELNATCGFTIWDGEQGYFFADSSKFPTPAEVFASLRSPEAVDLIRRIDGEETEFADLTLRRGGFAINRLCGDAEGEWIEVNKKPECFGEYFPNYECDEECVYANACREAAEEAGDDNQ